MNRLLDGHGMGMLAPDPRYVYAGTVPLSIRRGQARRVVQRFTDTGHSVHSMLGGVLWVVLEYCATEGIEVTVTRPEYGYHVERKDEL